MPASISAHGQSTLSDGRVLVTGGKDSGGTFSNNVYIYTPSTNAWTDAASLSASFYLHGQSTLNDGKVLVSGGLNANGTRSTVHVFTPDSNAWTNASPLSTGINSHSQSTFNDGRIMVSGGVNGTIFFNDSHVYEHNDDKWTSVPPMPENKRYHGESTLNNNRVLVSWGIGGSWNYPFNAVFIYTPNADNGTWAIVASLPVSFGGHGQSALIDNRILVSGGNSTSSGILNTAYVYTSNADTGSWATAKPMPTSFYLHGQSTLADGRVLVSGGTNGSTLNTAYIYTPAGWGFERVRHSDPWAIACFFYVSLRNIFYAVLKTSLHEAFHLVLIEIIMVIF